MNVSELIQLLQSKPQDLPVYLQENVGTVPGERRYVTSSLFDCNVAVMKNVDTPYLAIGTTANGVADADGSSIINVETATDAR